MLFNREDKINVQNGVPDTLTLLPDCAGFLSLLDRMLLYIIQMHLHIFIAFLALAIMYY